MKNVHGMTTEDVCSTMLVSERTVQRYVERFQQTGSVSRLCEEEWSFGCK